VAEVIRSTAIQRSRNDVRMRAGLLEQRVVDGLAGGVGRVRDAPHGVAAFAREVQAQRPVGIGRERHAGMLDQPLDGRALCSAMKRAVCSSTRPAPASCVSRTCDSMLSSSPSTPTMPPCAQAVAPSSSVRLASTTTGRWRPVAAPPSDRPGRHR
jgi:hypothetical protein